MINTIYSSVCGNLVYVAEYGDTFAVIGSTDQPLAYSNPNFKIESDDKTLIGDVVPYKLTIKFEDYLGADASKYESMSTITYISPCPYVGDSTKAYTKFEAITGTIATDAYSGSNLTIDIDSLYDVEADFCDDTIVYECTAVTRADGQGDFDTYTGTDYPKALCSLDDDNILTVSAGPSNYLSTSDPTVNMPPGTYTFTITGKSVLTAGITQHTVTTTVTWTLTDPCADQVIAMANISNAPFTYIITDDA